MQQSKFFRIAFGTLLIFLIILVGSKIAFVFQPLVVLVNTLFAPFLVGGVLYYLFRPIVYLLEKNKVPRGVSILAIYAGFAAIIVLIGITVIPTLQMQLTELVNSIPAFAYTIQQMVQEIFDSKLLAHLPESMSLDIPSIMSTVTSYGTSFIKSLSTNIGSFIGMVTSVVLVMVTVPFVLYYLLKEGEKAPEKVLSFLPKNRRENGRTILSQMDDAISSFIQGQVLVSFCVGVMLFIGYIIIGLEYALLLAIAAMFLTVIPFLGPVLATIPAVLVAITISPMMVVKVLIVMIIAQQIEGNFISPQVMGKKLEVHPLTIICILLTAGSLGGILGMILAVPFYAVLKVLVTNIYRLIQLKYSEKIE